MKGTPTVDKIAVTKNVTRFVVGASVSRCITALVSNNNAPENRVQQAQVVVGSMVVGAMVAERAKDWTDRQIDEAVDFYNEHVAPRLKKNK
jgi:hypothetical protein